MKILVVTQYFWPEQFKVNDLCDALIERGHQVTVYTGLPNYPEGKLYDGYSILRGPYRERRNGFEIIRIPFIPRGKSKNIQLVFNYLTFFIAATLLAPFLVKGKFDKIFVYEPSPITVAIPGIFLKYIKKAPMFFWVTDLWPESLTATNVVKNKYVIKRVERLVGWLYKHSDKILISSNGYSNRVKELGGRDSQIIYFPQWAESLYLQSHNSSFVDTMIPSSGFKIMFAGNIGTSQDFKTIIRAAILLKDHANIHFLVLGDGLMRKWAEAEILKHNLKNNFHFLGKKPIEMMPYYYSHADVMLMSLTDNALFSITVPSKLQTYMAAKKPILASMNGEGSDIVKRWNAGISVEASNPELLVEAILKMSSMHCDELKQFGSNAFKCYLAEFEREMLISKLEKLFFTCEYK